MSILDHEGRLEYILREIESLEREVDELPWRAFVRRHRVRSAIKRWRKALSRLQGETPGKQAGGIVGRIIGGIFKA